MDIEFDFKGDPVGGVITKCKLILFANNECIVQSLSFLVLCSPLYVATVVANNWLLRKCRVYYFEQVSPFIHMAGSVSININIWKDYILMSVNCNGEFWHLSPY